METDPLYADFRASSVSSQRRCAELKKYRRYRRVHPSWVNKEYYSLHLVSSVVHTLKPKTKNLRNKPAIFYPTHVIETDEPQLFKDLTRNCSRWNWFFWSTESEIHMAIAQAKAATSSIKSYPIVMPDESTQGNNSILPLLENADDPNNLPRISIEPPAPFPKSMPDNLHIKLRVNTWTKRDNFKASITDKYGYTAKYHRGKRRYREKREQKENEKFLGRGQKNRGVFHEDLCERASLVPEGKFWIRCGEEWWDPYDSVVYDPGWEWWWEDQYGLYEDNHEEVGCDDDWYYEGYFATIDKFRRGQAEFHPDLVFAESEFKSGDYDDDEAWAERQCQLDDAWAESDERDILSLIGSDVVMLYPLSMSCDCIDGDGDEDADDFDMLSDIADAIVEREWDVLSNFSFSPG